MRPSPDKPSWKLTPGDEIAPGRQVVRLLGGGDRFEVYLVTDDHLSTTAVAKVLRPGAATDERARRAIEHEATVLAVLNHPHIVRIFDAATDADPPHLVLEYLEGPTIGRLLRRHGPFAIEQLLPLAVTLAGALQYMTNEGWVHLDVKPDNVVMGITARLVDMSVARRLPDAARLTGTVGTRQYMSPEQCDPEAFGPIGPPADVWGLGATLYRAVAGTRPFPDGEGPYPQTSTDPAPLPAKIPRAVAGPIMACLARGAADRPTAAEVAASFEPLIAAMPRRPVLRRRRPRFR